MSVRLVGMGGLKTRFDKFVKVKEQSIEDLRRQVTMELLDAIIGSVPVWSGRSVRSVAASNSPSASNAVESHPDRGDTSRDGRWNDHKREWGDTKNMAIGSEPKRASAEAVARASAKMISYKLTDKVFVVSSAYNWDDIDTGAHEFTAPIRQRAQGKTIISELAVAQIKAMFGKNVK